VGDFPLVTIVTGRLLLDASPSPLLVPDERPLVVVKHVCTLMMRCSRCAEVKTTLGSLWPATQALPYHAVQMST
jgi:hypothetical protein